MITRKQYINKLMKWKDHKVIKVVTGVRRCGKSTLLDLFKDSLTESGVPGDACITLNLEDIRNEALREYHKLHDFILEQLLPDQMNYIFLDEIQLVPEFEKAVDSLFLQDNVDLYLTGSNARMLSGELATLLSGRYVEISMLPLSFSEYYSVNGKDKRDAFTDYYKKGGFPYTVYIKDEEIHLDYLQGIYSTVLLKDIVERKRITDVPLLEAVIRFLFDNIGNIVSPKKIADSLTSAGRKTTSITVDNYIQALKDAFILYEVRRYDIKGKQYLKSLEKYYLVDLGFRNMLLGERTIDIGHILENLVYLELKRRGFQISIGKIDDLEIDFIAQAGDEKIYYQVAASIMDPAAYEREFAPLKKIKDNYPKFVLTMDDLPMGESGIMQQNIIDFLLDEQLPPSPQYKSRRTYHGAG